MMSISDKSITAEITYEEMSIISNLLSEKIAELKPKLSTIDGHRFLKLCELHAKTCGMLDLIDAEANKRNEEKIRKEEMNKTINHVENIQ